MSGGEISNNTILAQTIRNDGRYAYADSYGGGVYADGTSTVFISGGEITGNTAIAESTEEVSTSYYAAYSISYGGGLYAKNGNLENTGGSVSGNTVTANAWCANYPKKITGGPNIYEY
jgi:hypothetical protein